MEPRFLHLHQHTEYTIEVETHARFSQNAATCSVLVNPAFMQGLELDGLEEDDLWSNPVSLYDPVWIGKWIKEHGKVKYESTIKTLFGWGAKFEDEEFLARLL